MRTQKIMAYNASKIYFHHWNSNPLCILLSCLVLKFTRKITGKFPITSVITKSHKSQLNRKFGKLGLLGIQSNQDPGTLYVKPIYMARDTDHGPKNYHSP